MNKFATFIAAAASLVASSAFAQGYVGGSIGATELDVDCSFTTTCDSSDVGFKLFGGYALGKGFSVEGSYIDFGKASASAGLATSEFTGTSFGAGGAYTLDFSPEWSGTGRLGLATNKAKFSSNVPGFGGDDSYTTFYYGLSIGFKVSSNVTINAAADFTRFKLEDEKSDARLLSVGATFAF